MAQLLLSLPFPHLLLSFPRLLLPLLCFLLPILQPLLPVSGEQCLLLLHFLHDGRPEAGPPGSVTGTDADGRDPAVTEQMRGNTPHDHHS